MARNTMLLEVLESEPRKGTETFAQIETVYVGGSAFRKRTIGKHLSSHREDAFMSAGLPLESEPRKGTETAYTKYCTDAVGS